MCTYVGCDKHGKCCECIRYHKKRDELPGCLFPPEVEKAYNKTIRRFLEVWTRQKTKNIKLENQF